MNKRSDSQKSLSNVHSSVNVSQKQGWRKMVAFLGPAYLVSVGYMDPGNWATDIAGGSQFGYKLIWVLLMSNLMALLLQSLCARLGLVRQMDLAQASRAEYRSVVNYSLWFLAEIAIAACDLAEVLGMAIGLQLLFDLPLIWGVSLSVLDTFVILLLYNYGVRKLEAFILGLVLLIGGAFFVQMLIAKPEIVPILEGFIPSLPNDTALYIAIGIIGATVMPHNLYLHSSLVQTRRIEHNNLSSVKKAIRYNFIDTFVALNAAFFVNAAILVLAAATFFKSGYYHVEEIQDAHKLLSPLLGSDLAPLLFGIALVAAGQSSTVTGTLAGQIVMEGYLNLRIAPWLRRLLTRLIALIPAYIVILFVGEDKTGDLLVFSQVVLSLQLGFAIIPLIHFTSDKKKMGKFVNTTWMKVGAWVSALVIVALNINLAIQEIVAWFDLMNGYEWVLWVTVIPACVFFLLLLLYITFKPFIDSIPRGTYSIPHGTALSIKNLEKIDYKRIGVAIDFSKVDILVIQSAIAQGGKEAEYTLVHVVETAVAVAFGDNVADQESKIDHQALENYASQLRKNGYNINIDLGYGNPKKVLPTLFKKFEADLVVMGAHGHHFISDLIFGTTVSSVRHALKVPVLIVRGED